jgi:hypothetical protein
MGNSLRAAALCAALTLTGCASIVNESNMPVHVDALAPNGGHVPARCTLTNGKGQWTVGSYEAAFVHRSATDLVASCETPPPAPMVGSATLSSSASGWLFGNILFGGFIGLFVDAMTGDGFGYPPNVSVPMQRTDSPSAAR